ncbi:MAG TPA: hypothetical protein VGP66_10350 [Candidatus Acidoferrum sp.]|jgi:hypothetical protein|nr:hypothetical protein [Candidatus Acidoferrum sp.]
MKRVSKEICPLHRRTILLAFVILVAAAALRAQEIPLQAVVTPSTVIGKNGEPIEFAIHGFIEFKSLAEVFPYIEAQTLRWNGKISEEERQKLARRLLREGIESRVISMMDERPLQALVTHTSEDLREAIAKVKETVPPGYAEEFLAVQEKWKHSLNCWSASPVIAGRVLSNWYPIEEGIRLHGAVYDSTEHFWQAAKYHPDTTVEDLRELIALLQGREWGAWLKRLDDEPRIYLANTYAVEFLRYNLRSERLKWFAEELGKHGLGDGEHARIVQQRGDRAFRFSGFEEKVLWGDLADLLHMVYAFSPADDPVRKTLALHHFDGIYLDGRKMGFISEEFRAEMLEIWKVKFLEIPRFREVIATIPMEIRLEHFLNDGDSPDIPIPVYVGYLNRIREMASTRK